MEEKQRIKSRILIPITGVILLLLSITIFSIYYIQNKNNIEDITEHVNEVELNFIGSLSSESNMLASHVSHLLKDPLILQSYINDDREELFNYCLPLFNELRSEFRITHFYFIDTTGACFLRVHNKPKYKDIINRYTFVEAKQKQKPAYGIELGTFGTFTLRFVNPITVNNETVGFIELGMEIEHITPVLKERSNIDLLFLIEKKFTNQENWEIGLEMTGKQGNWNEFTNIIIIDKTIDYNSETSNIVLLEENNQISASSKNKSYKTGSIPLIDAGNRKLGEIIVIEDISRQNSTMNKLLLFVIIISSLIGVILISSFFAYISNIQTNLNNAYNKLDDARKQAENDKKEIKIKNDEYLALNEEYRATNYELTTAVKRYEESETQLMESNKTKDRFFSIIAHDLRGPLGSILGLFNVLNEEFDSFDTEEKKDFFRLIYRDIQNTSKLLDNLLLWSRSQKGSIEYHPGELRLHSVANETIELLDQIAKNKNIKLINQIPEDIIVDADNNMLSTIIRNLISNAVKFTPEGGEIIIKASLISTENHKMFSEIIVSDSGVGIPEETQSKLFDIGEDTSTKGTNDEAGTGLGLILCKEFIEKHGGKIWVESEIQKGSSFYFTIPGSSGKVSKLG